MSISSRGPAFYIFLPLFVIFFSVPYLFDLAFCEELYATPLSQAALIDAEKVDPYDGDSSWTVADCFTADDVSAPPILLCFAPLSFVEGRSFGISIPVLLMSRPPPVS